MRLVFSVFLIFNAIELRFADDHLICEETDRALVQDGRHQITVAKGEKGNMGRPGGPGIPGRFDPAAISSMINDTVDPVIYEVTEKIEHISKTLKRTDSRITVDNVTGEAVVMPATEPTVNQQAACKLWFGQKCFWAIAYRYELTTFAKAEELCRRDGGHLANVYNPKEYPIILDYLKGTLHRRQRYTRVYLGMKVNPQNRSVSLRNGTPATFLPWSPLQPIFRPVDTRMTLAVGSNWAKFYGGHGVNGITETEPAYKAYGALCET